MIYFMTCILSFMAFTLLEAKIPQCPEWPHEITSGLGDPDLFQYDENTFWLSGTGNRLYQLENNRYFPCVNPVSIRGVQFLMLDPFDPINISPSQAPDQYPWDLSFLRVNDQIYASAASMQTAHSPYTAAQWPRDNIRRRSYFYHSRDWTNYTQWVRFVDAITNPLTPPTMHTWYGHSYGRSFLKEDDKIYYYYEKVITSSSPQRTCLWVAELDPNNLSAPPINEQEILCPGGHLPNGQYIHFFPSEERETRGHSLVEGPRISKWNELYLIFYSSSDFCSDRYSGNLAWSTSPTGPFKKVLTNDGADVRNILGAFNDKYTWLGRPNHFTHNGQDYLLFHGTKRIPGQDYSRCPWENLQEIRSSFIVPIRIDYFPQAETLRINFLTDPKTTEIHREIDREKEARENMSEDSMRLSWP